ncbi:hypothetical protein M427DRAFT_70847 [Gonapodya prolifera JEL478]|uniref:Myb-like domain-containing protein n=1 Tax=Gonapodya prolifera (strain JEL478) TaxID=1344416 RepID=A0A139AC62_GONPJ|nr:hypothetical protein M427DRAFT_70847 [Gonapodya prolifera JEL478]|eukprot:KXS14174.1 hypothetical protein M427DRAFT_70847 [Gonapodya prolifera JEL478]
MSRHPRNEATPLVSLDASSFVLGLNLPQPALTVRAAPKQPAQNPKRRFSRTSSWSCLEDALLRSAVAQHGPTSWLLVSQQLSGRSVDDCKGRWDNLNSTTGATPNSTETRTVARVASVAEKSRQKKPREKLAEKNINCSPTTDISAAGKPPLSAPPVTPTKTPRQSNVPPAWKTKLFSAPSSSGASSTATVKLESIDLCSPSAPRRSPRFHRSIPQKSFTASAHSSTTLLPTSEDLFLDSSLDLLLEPLPFGLDFYIPASDTQSQLVDDTFSFDSFLRMPTADSEQLSLSQEPATSDSFPPLRRSPRKRPHAAMQHHENVDSIVSADSQGPAPKKPRRRKTAASLLSEPALIVSNAEDFFLGDSTTNFLPTQPANLSAPVASDSLLDPDLLSDPLAAMSGISPLRPGTKNLHDLVSELGLASPDEKPARRLYNAEEPVRFRTQGLEGSPVRTKSSGNALKPLGGALMAAAGALARESPEKRRRPATPELRKRKATGTRGTGVKAKGSKGVKSRVKEEGSLLATFVASPEADADSTAPAEPISSTLKRASSVVVKSEVGSSELDPEWGPESEGSDDVDEEDEASEDEGDMKEGTDDGGEDGETRSETSLEAEVNALIASAGNIAAGVSRELSQVLHDPAPPSGRTRRHLDLTNVSLDGLDEALPAAVLSALGELNEGESGSGDPGIDLDRLRYLRFLDSLVGDTSDPLDLLGEAGDDGGEYMPVKGQVEDGDEDWKLMEPIRVSELANLLEDCASPAAPFDSSVVDNKSPQWTARGPAGIFTLDQLAQLRSQYAEYASIVHTEVLRKDGREEEDRMWWEGRWNDMAQDRIWGVETYGEGTFHVDVERVAKENVLVESEVERSRNVDVSTKKEKTSEASKKTIRANPPTSTTATRTRFIPEEEELLAQALSALGPNRFAEVRALYLPTKSSRQLETKYKNSVSRKAGPTKIRDWYLKPFREATAMEKDAMREGYRLFGKGFRNGAVRLFPYLTTIALDRAWEELQREGISYEPRVTTLSRSKKAGPNVTTRGAKKVAPPPVLAPSTTEEFKTYIVAPDFYAVVGRCESVYKIARAAFAPISSLGLFEILEPCLCRLSYHVLKTPELVFTTHPQYTGPSRATLSAKTRIGFSRALLVPLRPSRAKLKAHGEDIADEIKAPMAKPVTTKDLELVLEKRLAVPVLAQGVLDAVLGEFDIAEAVKGIDGMENVVLPDALELSREELSYMSYDLDESGMRFIPVLRTTVRFIE